MPLLMTSVNEDCTRERSKGDYPGRPIEDVVLEHSRCHRQQSAEEVDIEQIPAQNVAEEAVSRNRPFDLTSKDQSKRSMLRNHHVRGGSKRTFIDELRQHFSNSKNASVLSNNSSFDRNTKLQTKEDSPRINDNALLSTPRSPRKFLPWQNNLQMKEGIAALPSETDHKIYLSGSRSPQKHLAGRSENTPRRGVRSVLSNESIDELDAMLHHEKARRDNPLLALKAPPRTVEHKKPVHQSRHLGQAPSDGADGLMKGVIKPEQKQVKSKGTRKQRKPLF